MILWGDLRPGSGQETPPNVIPVNVQNIDANTSRTQGTIPRGIVRRKREFKAMSQAGPEPDPQWSLGKGREILPLTPLDDITRGYHSGFEHIVELLDFLAGVDIQLLNDFTSKLHAP